MRIADTVASFSLARRIVGCRSEKFSILKISIVVFDRRKWRHMQITTSSSGSHSNNNIVRFNAANYFRCCIYHIAIVRTHCTDFIHLFIAVFFLSRVCVCACFENLFHLLWHFEFFWRRCWCCCCCCHRRRRHNSVSNLAHKMPSETGIDRHTKLNATKKQQRQTTMTTIKMTANKFLVIFNPFKSPQ